MTRPRRLWLPSLTLPFFLPAIHILISFENVLSLLSLLSLRNYATLCVRNLSNIRTCIFRILLDFVVFLL